MNKMVIHNINESLNLNVSIEQPILTPGRNDKYKPISSLYMAICYTWLFPRKLFSNTE